MNLQLLMLIGMVHQADAPTEAQYVMTPWGWAFMLTSVLSVVLLALWCFYKVLTTPQAAEHVHAPLDIDTLDRGT